MANLPQDLRDKALEEAEGWERFRDGATFASSGGVPAITAAAGPAVGAICGAASASMVMLASRKIRAATRKANDPPDDDYTRPVRARRAHFNEDAFGMTPIERATVRASYAVLYSNAYDLAMVRAEERAEGAREGGDQAAEAARVLEARKFAYRAIESGFEVQHATSELARELRTLDVGREPFAINQIPKRLDLALPDETLVILFRAGFRIEDLRVPIRRSAVRPDDPIGLIADQMEAAGARTAEFAEALMPVVDEVFRPKLTQSDLG